MLLQLFFFFFFFFFSSSSFVLFSPPTSSTNNRQPLYITSLHSLLCPHCFILTFLKHTRQCVSKRVHGNSQGVVRGLNKIFKSVRSAKNLSQHFQEHILPNHSLLSRKGQIINTQEEVRASACKDFENDPVTSILWKKLLKKSRYIRRLLSNEHFRPAVKLCGTGCVFEFSSLVLDMTILLKVCTVLVATRLLYHYIEIHGHP